MVLFRRGAYWCAVVIVLLFFSFPCEAQVPSDPYQWKSVSIGGGGFVDGIIFHPTARGVRYCRTDMGGAYRWNETSKTWEPLLDWLSYEDRNLMGVESIAVDPTDPNFVILACGTYTNPKAPNGAILRSFDRGHTFQRTDVPFKFGGNENGRGNGERMNIDPNDPNTIYLGTRHNGLWRSGDKGATWTRVNTFPDVAENAPAGLDSLQQRRWLWQNAGSGIVFTLFDPKGVKKNQRTSVIYVGVSLKGRNNLYKSEDGGVHWTPLPGQSTQYRPTHAALAIDGQLYLTYGDNPGPNKMSNGAVWKFDTHTGSWTDITPDKPDTLQKREFGYAAVAVDPQHPQALIVSTYNRYSAGGEEIFRSLDGGKTWKPVFRSGVVYDNSGAPYVGRTGVHWLFDIEIDPYNSDHAVFTTGYGGHETFNLSAVEKGERVTWSVINRGIEETVALELVSPPKGAPLVSAIGDYGGFVHWDLDSPSPEGNFSSPHFGNTDGVACAEKAPDLIVRVGVRSRESEASNIGYSLDGGRSWHPTRSMPDPTSQHGHIAVSADGRSWVWSPRRSEVYVSKDTGNTWMPAEGISKEVRVIADRVNPQKFYALSLYEGTLFSSTDGGQHFSRSKLPEVVTIPRFGAERGDTRGGQDRLYATPGRESDLWLAAFDGLYHTPDGGRTFSKKNGVTEIHAFGFGKAAPSSDIPSLYLVGVVNGIRGIFRSDDAAGRWTRINDDQHQWGLLLHITGDPKKYGRVYIGTHGRGILYGDAISAH